LVCSYSMFVTLAGVSTVLAPTVTCHFLTKNIYYKSPKLTESPILCTHYSSCHKSSIFARLHFLHQEEQKITINEHLGVLHTGTAYRTSELRPCQCVRLGFRSETPTCKIRTNLAVDGYSAKTQASECLNCTQTFLLFS
jgi:hypothetical protein